MSRQNVEMIERVLDQAHDHPAALWEALDEEARWEVGELEIPDAGTSWRGPAGVREFFRKWVGAFDDWGYEIGELIDAGDSVVVETRQWGRGKGSGVPVENHFWAVWTIRNGKVVRATHHPERATALEVAGIASERRSGGNS
jgi:ketosteroid isomerase-like protein